MGKITTKQVFKQYDQGQILLLPPSLEELISEHHLVRIVNEVVDHMDLSTLINSYQGGGTSAYNPAMMLKVLLYGYSVKVYTGRKIARALRQDITFMWLAAYQRPDFRTINLFRSGIVKDIIESLFRELLFFLADQRYIKLEDYFSDGTSINADGNRHKMVWRKNAERYKAAALEKCEGLFKEIDELNKAEDQQYGNADLPEVGRQAISNEVIEGQIEKLDQVIASSESKANERKAQNLAKKLKRQKDKINHYQRQIDICNQRSGFNKTDPDASAMYTKEKLILPAYNILASSENQFVTAFSVHQNTNDGSCFKEHLEAVQNQSPDLPENFVGDSIFGTEQNYELLERHRIGNYLKFTGFHAEQTAKYINNPFLKDNFTYTAQTDSYTCPNNRQLTYRTSASQKHSKTGYVSHYKEYECEDCRGCSFAALCKKSEDKNRIIRVNTKLEAYKAEARENLKSEKGIELRKRRGTEIESIFGDIKQNMGFRRFHLRGKKKVTAEIGIVVMAHNLRKVGHARQKNTA